MISNFPSEFYAGDSLDFVDIFEYLPSDGWIADYYLLNNLNNNVLINDQNVIADPVDNNFKVSLTADNTSVLNFGTYNLSIKFTNTVTNAKITKSVKTITIKQDITQLQFQDNRSWAEIALENLTLVFQEKGSIKNKMYEIDGRKVESYSFKEKIELMNYLKSVVLKEQNIKNKKGNSKIYIQFTKK